MADLSYIAEPLRPLAVPIGDLNLDPNNARDHPEENLDHIKSSLAKFGQRKPIVVQKKDTGHVIRAGNGTFQAAKNMRWTHIAATVLEEDDITATAYALADNKTAETSIWNEENLKLSINNLIDTDYNMLDFGFDPEQLKDLLDSPGDPEPDGDPEDVPDIDKNLYNVEEGDLFQLGSNRLICGSSTDPKIVAKLFEGSQPANMVFTDPPYGIKYDGGPTGKREMIKNDDCDVYPFYLDFLKLAKEHSVKGATIYIWHASSETHNCIRAAIDAGWHYKQYLIWVKSSQTLSRQDYHWQHEPCFYGWGTDGSHKWHGDRKQTTVWPFDKPSRSAEHPTMKPIALCQRGIENSSAKGDIIYEPFGGSGSTLIAAESLKRSCNAIELDPHYVSVIIERFQNYTGKEAFKIDPESGDLLPLSKREVEGDSNGD